MTSEQIELIASIFGAEELHPEDICDYFDVISDAFHIHVQKESIRHGLWKDYPAEDQVNQIKIKVDRIVRSLERIQHYRRNVGAEPEQMRANIIEELLDIVNYAVFATRIVNGKVS